MASDNGQPDIFQLIAETPDTDVKRKFYFLTVLTQNIFRIISLLETNREYVCSSENRKSPLVAARWCLDTMNDMDKFITSKTDPQVIENHSNNKKFVEKAISVLSDNDEFYHVESEQKTYKKA